VAKKVQTFRDIIPKSWRDPDLTVQVTTQDIGIMFAKEIQLEQQIEVLTELIYKLMKWLSEHHTLTDPVPFELWEMLECISPDGDTLAARTKGQQNGRKYG
jgi:hypothetical protein